jgi:hypothetical protein
MDARMIGHAVQMRVGGVLVAGGVLEYLTADGWCGVREGRCLYEWPLAAVEIDPT